MTKRLSGKEQTHTGYTAQHERKLRRHAIPPSGGGRPLESVLATGSTSGAVGTGTQSLRGLNVGESVTYTLPMISEFDTTLAQDITLGLIPVGPGTYHLDSVQVDLWDPLTGDHCSQYDATGFTIDGAALPTWTDNGNTGTAWTWSGTGYQRATTGPFTGWAQFQVSRTS